MFQKASNPIGLSSSVDETGSVPREEADLLFDISTTISYLLGLVEYLSFLPFSADIPRNRMMV
jgi:hypothetical protein